MRKIDLTSIAMAGAAGGIVSMLASVVLSVVVAIAGTMLIVMAFATLVLAPLIWVLGQLVGPAGLAELSPLLIPIQDLAALFLGGFTAATSVPGVSAAAGLILPCLLVGLAYALVVSIRNFASWGVRAIASIIALTVVIGSIFYLLATMRVLAPSIVLLAVVVSPAIPALLFYHPELTGDFTGLASVFQIVPSAIVLCAFLPEGFANFAGFATSAEYRAVFLDSIVRRRERGRRFAMSSIAPAAKIFASVAIVSVGSAFLASIGIMGAFIGADALLRNGGEVFPLFESLSGIESAFAALGVTIGGGAAFIVLFGTPIVFLSALGWAVQLWMRRQAFVLREWTVVGCVAIVLGVCFFRASDFGDGYIYIWSGFQVGMLVLAIRGIMWRGLKQAISRSSDRLQAKVEEAGDLAKLRPILLLRAFKDDRRTLGRRWSWLDLLMGGSGAGPRFEEVLAQRAFSWRPMVALGNPRFKFQLFGALKKNVSDDAWQSEVTFWSGRAAYILMIGNKTDNLAWEIDHIRASGRRCSTIYVLTGRKSGREFIDHYGLLADEEVDASALEALVLFHDPEWGWTALTSSLRTSAAYAVALDVAIARKERQLRANEHSH